MSDIFISYKSQDRDTARAIAARFEACGYCVFWDAETPNGANWDQFIRDQLKAASVVIVLWSRAAAGSDNVRHEAQIARDAGTYAPALIEPMEVAELPMGMAATQMAKLYLSGEALASEWVRLDCAVRDLALARAPRWVRRFIVTLGSAAQRADNLREAAEAQAAALAREAKRGAAAQVSAEHEARVLADQVAALEAENQALSAQLAELQDRDLDRFAPRFRIRDDMDSVERPFDPEPGLDHILSSIRKIIGEEERAA